MGTEWRMTREPAPPRHRLDPSGAGGKMGGAEPAPSNRMIVATYDAIAPWYDRLVGPFHGRTCELAIALADIDPGDRVVELGTGPGRGAVALADRVGPEGTVIGIDAAPGMLDRARRRIGRWGVEPWTDLLGGDARSPPIRDGTADIVWLEDTLELFTQVEMEAVLRAARRMLRPDGQLVVLTMEREGRADTPFVRAYDSLWHSIPGFERVGCRPVYARRTIEGCGFDVVHERQTRRMRIWPLTIYVATPADSIDHDESE